MYKIRSRMVDRVGDDIVSPDSQQEMKTATDQGANHEPVAAKKAQSQEIEQVHCARGFISGQQSGRCVPELTPLQHDALTRIYVMLVDLAEEAASHMPANEAELVAFLQKRTNLTISLSAGQIEFLPGADLNSRVDCLLHLASEAQILMEQYRRNHRLKLGQVCDQIVELAHSVKATLETAIPTGGAS